ncbi:GNAT family N-acetyltransferase [Pseudogulbenkiania sp. MAI-1]|uniref:GNAT family N-acetyltransferase n=1 Tax=Pseudogulbenkiania sp. MAI-1 TaxID=990370 RepID=UPI00045E59AD|nr:GNAT family N-acetyltransferase [Pseudogulbenkiania sp. MAI-1]
MDILLLDSAGFDKHRDGLVTLLGDAVQHGASVGFLWPLDEATAGAYVDGLRASIDEGARLLWVALRDGHLVGSVQLELCLRENGRNRAEVQKLLVLNDARRGGIARQLMSTLETRARELERGLLYLDTEAGSPAEDFYRALGYHYAGGLPDYACGPAGHYRPNAIYYKTLFNRGAA